MAQYTPEFLAAAKHGYEDTDRPMTALAAELGIGITTLQSLVRKHGWTPRSKRMLDSPPALRLLEQAQALAASPERAGIIQQETPTPILPLTAGGSASSPGESSAAPSVPTLTPVERLEALVTKEIEAEEAARAELALRPRSRHDAERCARTLSVLTQTLQTLQRMRTGEGGKSNSVPYDDMPEDMDAFRRELARRIRIFVEGRRARRAASQNGATEQTGDGAPADDNLNQ